MGWDGKRRNEEETKKKGYILPFPSLPFPSLPFPCPLSLSFLHLLTSTLSLCLCVVVSVVTYPNPFSYIREYERRSGTGQGNRLGYEKKKGGSGKGNWGNPMEDYEMYKEERMRKTTN